MDTAILPRQSEEETPPPLTEQEALKLRIRGSHHGQLKSSAFPLEQTAADKMSLSSVRPWINTGTDTESTTDSRERSGTPTSESSASQACFVDVQASGEAGKLGNGIFNPQSPPEKKLVTNPQPLQFPVRPPKARTESNSTGEISACHSGPNSGASAAADLPQEHVFVTSPEGTVVPGTKAIAKPELKLSAKTISRGQRNIKLQKWAATLALIAINFMFIFATWWWPTFWFIYLPFISFPLVLNCVMIASIITFKLIHSVVPERRFPPSHKEAMVLVIPCYNETVEECTRSLDSLVDQINIDDHKKGIMIICDGRVRGPGMEKTTADYLFEDILVDQSHREKIKQAYTGWNGELMDIEVSWGNYKGVPFYCIVKEQNQGKRDSLIVIRSFLHKFNLRRSNPVHIFSSRFFTSMSRWLSHDVDIDKVDHLIGMDADTVFAPDCISELLKESTYASTVGVCGYVAVDFSGGSWNLWSLYQNAEYSIAQALRRLHQSIATHKVSCLPGCCQLLRVCETTCGDRVLIELFGYHPTPTDGMLKQIRATASEDRNHVCLMLTTCPEAQTRQALRAKAYTDVPHSWSVFLSQRRRWTLGATSNDLLLFTARHCQWWERIVAFSNVLTWMLNVFVIASIGCMIVAFMHQPIWIIMIFVGVMLIPITYYILMTVWLPRSIKDRAQYLAGLSLFVFCGPFLNITVMVFAVFNMDSFGWGKTRKVVEDDDSETAPEDSSDAGGGPLMGKPDGASEDPADSATAGGQGSVLQKPRAYDEEATRDALATNGMRSVTPPIVR